MKAIPHILEPCWEIESPDDMEMFVDALLVFEGSIAYMEDAIWTADQAELLEEICLQPPLPYVEPGIISPKPRGLHMPINADNIRIIKSMGKRAVT